ncbi:hypothetical protein, variant 1 [Batrachochytrium dendrobatidis JEL423]|uniref:Uncharacterized protein n=1 Tax=Batrachochytrium dendrobatidis (strain JEL423) TaxID=403673 RepID=A0A177WL59_BATDL|nr:hypothetical protein, variant 1 [Batrachochytrium dendrobatidis JEL423]
MSSTNAALFQHIEVQNPLEQDAPAINTNPANFPTLTSVAHSTTIRSDTTMSSLSVPASGSMTVSSVAGTKPGSSGLGLDDLQDERDQDQQQAELQPCENFNLVAPGIYRSAFPKKRNFSFLKKLGLRSILTLILEDYPDQNRKFLDDNNIHLFQFGVAGNKEPFVDIPEETVCAALSVIMDERNHPCRRFCINCSIVYFNIFLVLIDPP